MSVRLQRINGEILKSLAQIFRSKLSEKLDGAMVSVTRVETTSDLKHAKVYISVFATKDKAAAFEKIKGQSANIRRLLAADLSYLRTVPELNFLVDDSLEYSQKIDSIIEQLKKE